jgi:hypothetical protein
LTTNEQAKKTQSWQTKYFITIKNDNSTDLELTKKLLTQLAVIVEKDPKIKSPKKSNKAW